MMPKADWYSDPPALPYADPHDPDDNFELWMQGIDGELDLVEAAVARGDQVRQRRAAASREVEGVTRNLAFQKRAGGKQTGFVSLAPSVASAPARGPAPGKERMMPIFDPPHNAREMAKQLLLLEDHLVHPPRHCPDCIRKHLLTTEALAEEAVTLATVARTRTYFQGVAHSVRDLSRAYVGGLERGELQQAARTLRKGLVETGFDSIGSANSEPAAGAPASTSVPKAIAALKGGEEVLVNHPDDGWQRGTVAPVGSGYVDGGVRKEVKQIPEEGYLGYHTADGSLRWVSVSHPAPPSIRLSSDGLVVLGATPISTHIAEKLFSRYRTDGTLEVTTPLSDEQLLVADLIEAGIRGGLSGAALCKKAGVTSGYHQHTVGCSTNIIRNLVAAAIVTAWYQSDLSQVARAGPASGRSGVFGLRPGPLARGDRAPATNIGQFVRLVEKQISITDQDPGSVSALVRREANMHPTSVGDWVAALTPIVLASPNRQMDAQARRKTADEFKLWTPPRTVAPATTPLWDYGADLEGHATDRYLREFRDDHLRAIDSRVRTTPAWAAVSQGLPMNTATMRYREVQSFRRAARSWLRSGRQHNQIFALARAAALSVSISDAEGAMAALGELSGRFPSAQHGVEARHALTRLAQTHGAPPAAVPTTLTTPQAAGLAVAAGLLLLAFAGGTR